MIAYIKGKVIDRFDGGVILENNGIGYEIFCSSAAFARLCENGTSVTSTLREHLSIMLKRCSIRFSMLPTTNGLTAFPMAIRLCLKWLARSAASSASTTSLDDPCVQVEPQEAAYIHDISKLMRSVLCDYAPTSNREKIISSLFAAMFHYVMGILQQHSLPGNGTVSNRTDELFNNFLALLREHCSTERSVEFYASKMGITPKYLSLILKKKSGRNASKLIDEAVVYEAKRLLKYSGLSIQEISNKLNFASQSFFGKYFKQRVGVSPSRYKIWDGRTDDNLAEEFTIEEQPYTNDKN